MSAYLKIGIPVTIGLLIILGGLYAFFSLGMLRNEYPAPEESPVLSVDVEEKIEAATEDRSAYYIELSNQDVVTLIADEDDSEVPKPQTNQPVLPEVLVQIKENLEEGGINHVQLIKAEEDKVIVVGVQPEGRQVSDTTRIGVQEAVGNLNQRVRPTPPGGDVVPQGSYAQKEGNELYLAMGNSLAAGTGLTYAENGYVSRFHSYLERETGKSLGLLNLGVPGENSGSIISDQFPKALKEIYRLRNDGNPETKVSVLTIDLGANDVLGHLGSTRCFEVPDGAICETRIDAALQTFQENFKEILSALAQALEPDAEFYVMTVYNPFDFGLGTTYGAFTNGVVESLNAIIQKEAEAVDATVADPYPLMKGKAAAWTHMLRGDIHPNADGYQVLALSLAQAREKWKGN